MTTSVIVLSHRPGEWLSDCLASVTDQADEIVLIDNGSAEAVASTIGHAAGVSVFRFPDNRGFAAGVNLGLRRATGEVIALLNDDAVAGPGWIRSAEHLLGDHTVAAVVPRVRRAGWYRQVVFENAADRAVGDVQTSGRVLHSITVEGAEVIDQVLGIGVHPLEHDPADPNRVWRRIVPGRPFYIPVPGPEEGASVFIDGEHPPPGPICRLLNKCGGYLRPDGTLGDYGDETPDDGRGDRPAERFFASGTALVARADTFRRIGGLAEPFFAYYEDADWSWRARLAGLRVLYDPGPVVDHRHSATSGGAANPLVRQLAQRNRLLCVVRNAPAAVAATFVRQFLSVGSPDLTRRAAVTRLPWALASRRKLTRRWELRPDEVWDRWTGVDQSWDVGPARLDPPRVS